MAAEDPDEQLRKRAAALLRQVEPEEQRSDEENTGR
jgi:hypothetical protein